MSNQAQGVATMRVPIHMHIIIELIIQNNKSTPNIIYIDTLLRDQEGATNKVLRNMSHHLGMPGIVIVTRHIMIFIATRHHMIITNTHHLMIALDDTPQDMVMIQDDDKLDMKSQQ